MDNIFCIYLNVCLINNLCLCIINFTRTRHRYSSVLSFVTVFMHSVLKCFWSDVLCCFFSLFFSSIDEIVALLNKNPQRMEICQIWIKMKHKKVPHFRNMSKIQLRNRRNIGKYS